VSIFHAIVMGLVQGFAEFLPISSSGHLILVSWVLGDDFGDDDSLRKAFHVALHIGTLIGAIAYFKDDIKRYVQGALLDPKSADGRMGWYIGLSALPTAMVGALLSGVIESGGSRQIWLIAVMLIVGGIGLGWADGTLGKRPISDLNRDDVVKLSLAQVLSLQPGLSRAGITITVGRFIGMDRDAATRFAFLMSMPVIFGAIVYKYVDIGGWSGVPSDMRPAFMIGIVTSALTGYLAIRGLIALVQNRSFFPFVVYRLALGLSVLGLLALGVSS
jgi:undecaprenyl-diphosphatase